MVLILVKKRVDTFHFLYKIWLHSCSEHKGDFDLPPGNGQHEERALNMPMLNDESLS